MTDPPPNYFPVPNIPPPQLQTQSFRVDEGYSGGEETPGLYDESLDRFMRDRGDKEIKIPAWMTGLNDALREEYAYKLVRTLPTSHIASLVDRLVPILHLDFVQILPSELSLQILSYLPPQALLHASLASRTWRRFALEPRLWRDLYKAEGWEANEEEVKKFEQEMRDRAEEARRKADNQAAEERKIRELVQRNEERIRAANAACAASAPPGESQSSAMDTTPEWATSSQDSDVGSADPLAAFKASAAAGEQGSSFMSMSDEDEMYPTPLHTTAPTYADASLPIEPGLTTPGYDAPRLNWAFLFKNRKRLEDNWRENRYTNFEIPHPKYPQEGHSECIYTLQYSPNWLVSGSRDRTIRIWNAKTRRLRTSQKGVLTGHEGSVLCLQFDESPEEDIMMSGSSDSSVIMWRFSTGERLKVIEKAHTESVLNLRFNKKWLITCSKDKLIKVWNRHQLDTTNPDYPWYSKALFGPQGAPLNHPHHPRYSPSWTVQHPAATSGLGLHNPFGAPGCKIPYAPLSQSNVKNIPPYTTCQALEGHVAAVNAIQLHDNEIVSASGDRTIKLWNLKTAMCEKTFLGHKKGIACIQYDGHYIVSGSSDKTIRVFDKNTQAEIATLIGHESLVRTVQASRDRIVSGSYDESVRIWRRDLDTHEWCNGPVLRQFDPAALARQPGGPSQPQNHSQLQMHAMQQFQANAAAAASGAIAFAPPPVVHNVHHVQNHAVHSVTGPGLAGAVAAAQLLPAHHHANGGHHPPPVSQQQQQQQQQQHRVFKLQFDARWIICSQDSRIVGWDFAADDESMIEASRFFKGESETNKCGW